MSKLKIITLVLIFVFKFPRLQIQKLEIFEIDNLYHTFQKAKKQHKREKLLHDINVVELI